MKYPTGAGEGLCPGNPGGAGEDGGVGAPWMDHHLEDVKALDT